MAVLALASVTSKEHQLQISNQDSPQLAPLSATNACPSPSARAERMLACHSTRFYHIRSVMTHGTGRRSGSGDLCEGWAMKNMKWLDGLGN